MSRRDADPPSTNGEHRPDSSPAGSDAPSRLDDRMPRLLTDQLTADERASLEREAAEDPALRRQAEAFRPLARARLDAIARLGLANRDRPAPTTTGSRRFGPWIPILGLLAVAGLALVWALPRPSPRYQLEGEVGRAPVAFDAPIRLRLAPQGPTAPLPVAVEVWARRETDAQPTRVRAPVRETRDGRVEIGAPAHRITGGRFGPVTLDLVVTDRKRPPDAPFPNPDDPGVRAVLRTSVAVGPPTYEVAYLSPTTGARARAAAAAPDRPTIELRPAVPVRSGLYAHLYTVDGDHWVRVDVAPQPIGDQGVLRLPLPPSAAAGARWLVAVGPASTPLPVEKVWAHGQRIEPIPAGWWLTVVVPPDASSPSP